LKDSESQEGKTGKRVHMARMKAEWWENEKFNMGK